MTGLTMVLIAALALGAEEERASPAEYVEWVPLDATSLQPTRSVWVQHLDEDEEGVSEWRVVDVNVAWDQAPPFVSPVGRPIQEIPSQTVVQWRANAGEYRICDTCSTSKSASCFYFRVVPGSESPEREGGEDRGQGLEVVPGSPGLALEDTNTLRLFGVELWVDTRTLCRHDSAMWAGYDVPYCRQLMVCSGPTRIVLERGHAGVRMLSLFPGSYDIGRSCRTGPKFEVDDAGEVSLAGVERSGTLYDGDFADVLLPEYAYTSLPGRTVLFVHGRELEIDASNLRMTHLYLNGILTVRHDRWEDYQEGGTPGLHRKLYHHARVLPGSHSIMYSAGTTECKAYFEVGRELKNGRLDIRFSGSPPDIDPLKLLSVHEEDSVDGGAGIRVLDEHLLIVDASHAQVLQDNQTLRRIELTNSTVRVTESPWLAEMAALEGIHHFWVQYDGQEYTCRVELERISGNDLQWKPGACRRRNSTEETRDIRLVVAEDDRKSYHQAECDECEEGKVPVVFVCPPKSQMKECPPSVE